MHTYSQSHNTTTQRPTHSNTHTHTHTFQKNILHHLHFLTPPVKKRGKKENMQNHPNWNSIKDVNIKHSLSSSWLEKKKLLSRFISVASKTNSGFFSCSTTSARSTARVGESGGCFDGLGESQPPARRRRLPGLADKVRSDGKIRCGAQYCKHFLKFKFDLTCKVFIVGM